MMNEMIDVSTAL